VCDSTGRKDDLKGKLFFDALLCNGRNANFLEMGLMFGPPADKDGGGKGGGWTVKIKSNILS
jgi:hypothetical protein